MTRTSATDDYERVRALTVVVFGLLSSGACTTADHVLAWEDACPSTVLSLDVPDSVRRVGAVSGDTTARTLSLESPTCGGGGNGVVYALTSDVEGEVRVRLDAAFDALLYVRTKCTSAATEMSCKAVPAGGGRAEMTFQMAENRTAYVVVDGVGGASGRFDLTVEIEATSMP